MTVPPRFPSDDDLDTNFQIQQNLKGNQNQSVGQVNASAGGVVNVNNYPFSPDGIPLFPRPTGQAIPYLLPYLPNRMEQEKELEKRLKNYPINENSGPLICIVHGDERQSHHVFVDRLRKRVIDSKLNPSVDCSLPWYCEDTKLDDLESHFCKELGSKLVDNRDFDNGKIHQVICEQTGPVIVRISLLTENWQSQGFCILEKLLKFWQIFSVFPPKKGLIIFFLIKYQLKCYKTPKKFIFLYLISCFMNYLRQLHYQYINKKIRKQLDILSKSEFKEFDRLIGMVLPELTAINLTHVDNWATEEEVKKVLGVEMIGKLKEEIGKMFRNWEQENSSPHIPMSELADRLTKIIKELQSFMGAL
jgi:hypothetical protein